MKFEYDENKNLINKQKHGLDFEEAQALWNDSEAINIRAKSDTEVRYAFISKLHEKYCIAFYTLRGDAIRLISVRRAREEEQRIYDES
ncbi:MAG: BrnT family toxin [Campylobacterales bacterium]|nr:BrnT family toxin [Campylobacterales bacterium]